MILKEEFFQSINTEHTFYNYYNDNGQIEVAGKPLLYGPITEYKYDDKGRVISEYTKRGGEGNIDVEFYRTDFTYTEDVKRALTYRTGFYNINDDLDQDGNRIKPPIQETNELTKIKEEFYNEKKLTIRKKVFYLPNLLQDETIITYDFSGRKTSESFYRNNEKRFEKVWLFDEIRELKWLHESTIFYEYRNNNLSAVKKKHESIYYTYDKNNELSAVKYYNRKNGREKLETEVKIERKSQETLVYFTGYLGDITLNDIIPLPHRLYDFVDLDYYLDGKESIKIKIAYTGKFIRNIKLLDIDTNKVKLHKYFINETQYSHRKGNQPELVPVKINGLLITKNEVEELFTWSFYYEEEKSKGV